MFGSTPRGPIGNAKRVTTLSRAIVADHHFILATRATGYRNLANAVAELIDNSVQAKASEIHIFVTDESAADGRREREVTLAVMDDGEGMDRMGLWTALQFGGTGRFDDRSGLGRFGMGLPNSSVSQSKRLEVYTWQRGPALFTYLDVDEIARSKLTQIPAPAARALPAWARAVAKESGTLVVWNRCDRLDFRKASTIEQKLFAPLGRMYRRIIWNGVTIAINGRAITPADPLFSHPVTGEGGGAPYGRPLTYEVTLPHEGSSTIKVRFTELPVLAWGRLDDEVKRERGVIGGAGVSFVRADREIDYAWLLVGNKRKENYDDWWRCEISFAPTLDELFGVTHSKQGVAPTPQLQAILGPELEAIARALNSRVRQSFETLRSLEPSRATQVATRHEQLLPPIRHELGRVHSSRRISYVLRTAKLGCHAFFDVGAVDGKLMVTINTNHPFYDRIYAPALAAAEERQRYGLECLILAAARAEWATRGQVAKGRLEQHRADWGDALTAFLEGRV